MDRAMAESMGLEPVRLSRRAGRGVARDRECTP
jgi:hypothetical protein